MGDLNQKLINEIEYLSRLIDNHKSQAANTQPRQSSKFSKFCINKTYHNYRTNSNLKLNKLQNNRNHVQNGLFKNKINPYKIDRTVSNLTYRKFSCNKNSTGEGTFVSVKQNPQVSTSCIQSESKTTSKLQEFIQCSPILITIQDQSKSISVGHSEKVKVFKNDSKELPNISVTKHNSRLLQIKTQNKIPEKCNIPLNTSKNSSVIKSRLCSSMGMNKVNLPLSANKVNSSTINKVCVPSISVNKIKSSISKNNVLSVRTNKVCLPINTKTSSLSKSFQNKNDKTVLKTKYKVVNYRNLARIKNNNWKCTLKGKQSVNTVYPRSYVSSPWKLIYRNQPRITGKYLKPLNWINHHSKNFYYKQQKYYIKRNNLYYKRWRKQSLASRRKIYTGTIAKQVKKNPVLKSRMMMIGGLLYKVSKTKLSRACKVTQNKQIPRNQTKHQTLLIRGIRYQMDPSGKVLKRLPNQPIHTDSQSSILRKNLKRIDLGGDTYIQTKPGVLTKTTSSQARTFVNRVVNRSIYHVLAADQKKSRSKNNLYCMFYNRFGRCNKGDSCPYKHDPDKIAVCTRFLRGTCKVVDCPFSHKVAPEKMPVCSFYLQGRCNNDNCPYRHVKVNRSAEVCKDFLRGYCPVGQKCKKTHTLVCQEYLHNGSCKNGDRCPMKHTVKKGQKRKCTDESETQPLKKAVLQNGNKEEGNKNSCHIITCEIGARPAFSEQPSFISLGDYEEESDSITKITTTGKSLLLIS